MKKYVCLLLLALQAGCANIDYNYECQLPDNEEWIKLERASKAINPFFERIDLEPPKNVIWYLNDSKSKLLACSPGDRSGDYNHCGERTQIYNLDIGKDYLLETIVVCSTPPR
ncbi:hypothetical protein ACJJIE_11535 [Microbulbifer sp. TRSA001]|uniref:hypothetical protein n=1 Tax=unclassified Microbulbifer TaxID=2619833 RepID=UPI0024ACFD36|nr:hypothetical protein [Microbulbifer sp. VAAF005]WHI45943.1 hypothetical protein P0078_19825 [Microbulbifer sp. VAAF005]